MAQCVLQSEVYQQSVCFFGQTSDLIDFELMAAVSVSSTEFLSDTTQIDFELMAAVSVSSTEFLSDTTQIECEAVGVSIIWSFYMLSTSSNYWPAGSQHQAQSTVHACSFHAIRLIATLALHSAWQTC